MRIGSELSYFSYYEIGPEGAYLSYSHGEHFCLVFPRCCLSMTICASVSRVRATKSAWPFWSLETRLGSSTATPFCSDRFILSPHLLVDVPWDLPALTDIIFAIPRLICVIHSRVNIMALARLGKEVILAFVLQIIQVSSFLVFLNIFFLYFLFYFRIFFSFNNFNYF